MNAFNHDDALGQIDNAMENVQASVDSLIITGLNAGALNEVLTAIETLYQLVGNTKLELEANDNDQLKPLVTQAAPANRMRIESQLAFKTPKGEALPQGEFFIDWLRINGWLNMLAEADLRFPKKSVFRNWCKDLFDILRALQDCLPENATFALKITEEKEGLPSCLDSSKGAKLEASA